MARKRRVLGATFKAKVALAATKEDKTLSELAGKFQVHGNQVSAWKKTLVERAAELFEDGRKKSDEGPSVEGGRLPLRPERASKLPAVSWAGNRRFPSDIPQRLP